MSHCGIVILAAGASSRLGVAKQTLEYQGKSLLHRAIQTALGSACSPVVVVLGARAELLKPSLDEQTITMIVNPNWERGMGTSIRVGVGALMQANLDAVMILLCDQPLVRPEQLNQLVISHFENGKPVTAARYAGTLGTPVIFSAQLFDELLSLGDGMGGKAIVQRHADQVMGVDLPEAELDIDTTDDFERLLKWNNDSDQSAR